MPSRVPASTPTLAGRVLLSTWMVLLASLAPISLALATAAMDAHMVARAMSPFTAVNPPVAKPVVARTMAAMTVVGVRRTATANAPSVKYVTIGGMLHWTARISSTRVSTSQQQQPAHRKCDVY
jgi:hypothetical protein